MKKDSEIFKEELVWADVIDELVEIEFNDVNL